MSPAHLALSALAAVFVLAGCASAPPADSGTPALSAEADEVGNDAAPQAAGLGPPADATAAVVAEVIDGDTVIIDFGSSRESVRLIGIDTPEPRGGIQPPECFGDEASAFTRQLLPSGSTVLLTRDVEARDVYDRLLGYVYRESDGLFVNLALVESGHADTLEIPPNDTHAAAFASAADDARDAGLGLWGTCGGPDVLVAD